MVAPTSRAARLLRLDTPPFSPGLRSDAVRDLQRRLAGAGCAAVGAVPGVYCPATEKAVREFQASVGLRPDGQCDAATWQALLEVGRVLGERLLWHTQPNLRGDDVAELQSLLARLGFDSGKIDGIFGPDTESALSTFQRNSGLLADGMCGPVTVATLSRVSRQTGTGPGVNSIRDELRSGNELQSLVDARVVVGHFGALGSVVRQVSRSLRAAGALVVPVEFTDPLIHAQTANQFDADVYIGLESCAELAASVTFYAVPTFESFPGRRLANGCARALLARRALVDTVHDVDVVGRRLIVLRETRMPAIVCTIGPVRDALERGAQIAAALCDGLSSWIHQEKD